MIEDIFQSYGLRRTVFVETRGKSCLDNIFTNYSNHIISAEVFDTCLSDHKSVSIQYKTDTLPILKTRINYCPITQQGINQLYAAIEACDWTFTNDRSLTPSNKMDIFIETIMRESEKSFPEKSRLIEIEPKCNYRINWFTDEVRYYRECLHLMTSLRKQNPSHVSNSDLREFRNIYRNVIHTAKKNANDSYIKKHSNTQKAMWVVIRSNNPVKATNASQNISANEFNDYFVEIANKVIDRIPQSKINLSLYLNKIQSSQSFRFEKTSIIEVRDIISSLKNTNSKDTYNMNSKIIKALKNLIASPLCKIFNECIVTCTFPQSLKTSRVVPIHKHGSLKDVSNFRPISIIPVIAKVFETILNKQLITYFETSNLLSKSQYGFRKNKSTTLAMVELVEYIYQTFDKGNIARATFFDLMKAFDCVSHGLLIEKLSRYGFESDSLQLIASYLDERVQYVALNGAKSRNLLSKLGVPQGSILGPTLFIIFINDLVACQSQHLVLYADDTTSISSSSTLHSLDIHTASRVEVVEDWFLANNLCLNKTKTQTIDFTLRHLGYNQDIFVKSLGFYLDNRLTWEQHISHLCAKLNKSIFVIRSLVNCVSHKVILQAYYSYFYSHMVYGVLLWGHSSHASRVFALQRKCLRVMYQLGYRDSCVGTFTNMGILTLPSVYILDCLMYVKRNISNYSKNLDFHSYQTRYRNNIVIPYSRVQRARDGHNFYGIKFYNLLPELVKSLSTEHFKRKLKVYLKQKAFYSICDFIDNDFSDLF
nr:unnamed protein product [Callosobruchus analis]